MPGNQANSIVIVHHSPSNRFYEIDRKRIPQVPLPHRSLHPAALGHTLKFSGHQNLSYATNGRRRASSRVAFSFLLLTTHVLGAFLSTNPKFCLTLPSQSSRPANLQDFSSFFRTSYCLFGRTFEQPDSGVRSSNGRHVSQSLSTYT